MYELRNTDSTLCYAQPCLKCGTGIPKFTLDGDAARFALQYSKSL